MSARTLKKALELAENRSAARNSNVQGPAARKSKNAQKRNKRKQQIEKKLRALEEALQEPSDNYEKNIRYLTKSMQNVETEDLQKVKQRVVKTNPKAQTKKGSGVADGEDSDIDFGFGDDDF